MAKSSPLIPAKAWLKKSDTEGKYRYHLERYVKGHEEDAPLLFIMLNPSKADGEKDDQTIIKCIGFAQQGFRGDLSKKYYRIQVINLFSLVKTQSKRLADYSNDELGGTPLSMREMLEGCDRIIVAWGGSLARKEWVKARKAEVVSALQSYFDKLYAINLTRRHHPRHPSRAPYGPLIKVKFRDSEGLLCQVGV